MPSLVVDIQAKFASFEQSLKRIEGQSAASAKRIEGAFSSFKTLLPIAAVTAAVGGFGKIAASGIAAAAALDDLSEKTSLSVEFLSQLETIATRTGANLETVASGAGRFARSVAEARAGNAELAAAFRAVGISAADLRSQNIDQLFQTYAKAIANAEDPTNALAVAVKLAGKSAAESIPFYKDLAAQGLGLATTTTEQAAAAERLQNQFREIKVAAEAMQRTLANFLVPVLAELIVQFRTMQQLNLKDIFNLSLNLDNVQSATRELDQIQARIAKLREAPIVGSNADLLPPEVRAFARGQENELKRLEARSALLQRLLFADANARPGKPPEQAQRDVRLPSATPAASRGAPKDQGISFDELLARNAIKRAQEQERIEAEGELAANKELAEFKEILLRGDIERERIGAALSEQAERERTAQIASAEAVKDRLDPTRAYFRELENIARLQEDFLLTEREAVEAVNQLAEAFKRANTETKAGSDIARDLGLTFTSAFESAVAGGKSFRDILKSIESDLLRLGTRKLVTEPLLGGLEKILKGGSGGFDLAGLAGRAGSAIGSFFGFANGGAFAPGGVQAFAGGGIVSRPTLFPFASGGALRTGLMGEAGPEAIMPLQRGRDGKLGVAGGGGATVVFNVATPDANSFRAAQGQLMADAQRQLSRASRRNG
jgi:lambda family phage tail tape measure protein